MYKTPYYSNENPEDIIAFMDAHPFVTLVGFDGEFPVATQVPVKLVNEGSSLKLIGHIMTKTDHCRTFQTNPKVLALFTGSHGYVSASVYEKPNVASTWNYRSVQTKGIIKLLSSQETYQIIKDITDNHEDPRSSPSAFHKIDDDYIRKNLKAITGFEILVSEINHVFKMSQDHSQKDREAIAKQFEQNSDPMAQELANDMQHYL